MKIIIRNLVFVLRRFRTATLLNVLGLTIAYAAFMIIMMQVYFDYTFNKVIKDYDLIYRVEVAHGDGSKQGVISRPAADLLFQSSPHIVAGSIDQFYTQETFFSIEEAGSKKIFKERSHAVYPSHTQVFPFEMITGDIHAMNDPQYIIIPQSLADKLFEGESALGQKLEKQIGTWVVGGVYKDFPANTSIQNIIYYSLGDENIKAWGNSNYHVYIKVDSPDAVSGLYENFKKANRGIKEIENITFQFTPLAETYYTKGVGFDNLPKSSRETVAILFAIGIVIVVIAGINFTNFSMALTPARIKTLNTQKVLGSTSAQLRIILVGEAICISLFAFLLSLLLVLLAAKSPLANILNADISLTASPAIVAVAAILSLVTGLLSGIYPAYYMTSFPTALVLKGSFGLSPQGRKTRNILISVQFIASVSLTICSGFMYLQNQYFSKVSHGYDKDVLIVSDLNGKANREWTVLKNRLEAVPGIEKTEKSYALLASSEDYMGWGVKYKENQISFECLPVGVDFLDVMGIKLTDGRDFMISDTIKNAFIFNETARKKYNLELNSEVEGIGKIVGFIPDIKFASLRAEVAPMALHISKYFKRLNNAYIRVRAGNDLYEALDQVKSAFASVDSEYPFNIRFFDDVLNVTYEKENRLISLITLLCLIAIFISIVGVFGLVVFECEYRRKEIGIRKVLGSSVKEILFLFCKTYLTILAICSLIAIPLCYYFMTKWLENFAYHIPIYWWVFVLGCALVFLITIITVSWQSWRAAIANPVDALKTE